MGEQNNTPTPALLPTQARTIARHFFRIAHPDPERSRRGRDLHFARRKNCRFLSPKPGAQTLWLFFSPLIPLLTYSPTLGSGTVPLIPWPSISV
jgi:hypothetical protein